MNGGMVAAQDFRIGNGDREVHVPSEPRAMAKPVVGMSFSELVDEIERRHGFSPAKRKTLIARIQQLHKMGLSKRTGKGARAAYDKGDLARMSEVLDMLDMGISPGEALRRLNGDRAKTLDYLR